MLPGTASTWGWQGTSEALTGYVTYWVSQQQCVYDARPYYYNVYSSWVYNDGQGTAHSFPGLSVSNGNSTSCVIQYPSYSGIGSSTDGSGFQIQVDAGPDATVYSVSGVAITAPLQTPNPTSGTYKITDPNGNVISSTVFTHFDMLGRVYTVSNPYCTTSDPTYGITTYLYDALNRTTSVEAPNGSTTLVSFPTTNANCPTVTDPAGKARTFCSDALGRITSVTENPSSLDYLTAYTYDDLNDLTKVAQGSSQTRNYSYDMLGRLTSAQIPEAGTTTYSYAVSGSPCSGNPSAPCSRTDARSVTTTYAYDALNRPTSKSYNDTPRTPSASFFYDQAPSTMPSWTGVSFSNPKGRLVLSCTNTTLGTCTSPATATAYSYDPVGRTANFWQCNPSNCGSSTIWNTQYNYDWGGDVTSWVHPDKTNNATLTNTVNPAQQITAVQSSLQDSYHPQYLAQNITYTAWGAVSTLENGCVGSGCTNTQETYAYNRQLQPAVIELGTSSNPAANYCLVYNYYGTPPTSCALPSAGTTDNGNVLGYWYQDSVNSSFSHTATYTYDNVNRLTAAVATGNSTYNQTYSYGYPYGDGSNGQYGNMTCVTGCAQMPAMLTVSPTSNQITTAGYTYDAAGDLTKDSSNSTAHTYQWDAEGRVSTVDGGTTWTFTYDAVGDRVAWVSGGTTYNHLFDPAGNWLGVAGSYSIAMLGIRPLVVYTSSETWFHHVNNIDSRTFMTGHYGTVLQDMVFYPFGGLWLNWGGGGLEFADLPYRDTTTNTDLTMNRVTSPNLGRWHSPDPLGGDVTNPQSLNRYAYVLNNPTTLTDPLGLDPCTSANTGPGGSYACSPEHAAQSNEGGGGGGGVGSWDEFDLMNLGTAQSSGSTTAQIWVNAAEVDTTIDGISYPGPSMPGYWATVAVVTAWVPDYVSLNINVGIVGGGTIAINLDRNGHLYVGPGLNVGKSLSYVSYSLTANWLNQSARPSESQLNSFLTRNSFNFTAGYWGGVQVGWTPGSGTSSGAGFVSPQVGLAWTYSWKLF